MRATLTDIVVRNAKPPARGQRTVWDASVQNFGCRLSQGGTKSWIVMHGRRRQVITIGRYPMISLSAARTEAKRILAERTLDPRRSTGITFKEALALFISTHCEQHNRPSTAKETVRLLTNHFLEKFSQRSLEEISTQDVAGLVDRLLPTPSEANHAFTAIRTFFRWATRRRFIAHSPCEGMQLPARTTPRDRVLSDDEIRAIFRGAVAQGFPSGTIVLLLLFTGQRRNEIASLRWEYIDTKARTITLPPSLTKNGRRHSFPYSRAVKDILQEMVPSGEGSLFAARGNPATVFSGWSKAKTALDFAVEREAGKRPVPPWTLHDLRRTFATNLAKLGTPPHVVEKLLNHASGTISGVAAIYNQFQYMDEMRSAIEAWDAKLASLMTG
jgi:integrase